MELERSYNAQRERQKRMLELPQKAVHISWIKLLDYFFNYPGLCMPMNMLRPYYEIAWPLFILAFVIYMPLALSFAPFLYKLSNTKYASAKRSNNWLLPPIFKINASMLARKDEFYASLPKLRIPVELEGHVQTQPQRQTRMSKLPHCSIRIR